MTEEKHNPLWACWCDKCSGNMCGCPCHKEIKLTEADLEQLKEKGVLFHEVKDKMMKLVIVKE